MSIQNHRVSGRGRSQRYRGAPTRPLAAAVAAGVVALAGTAYASAPGVPAKAAQTIHLVEATEVLVPTFVDVGDPGPSAGDGVIVRDDLLVAKGGAKAGVLRQACTLVDAGKSPLDSTYECQTSLELHAGTITLAGPFVAGKPVQVAAVTGGTGAYKTARGEAFIRAEADEIVVKLAY